MCYLSQVYRSFIPLTVLLGTVRFVCTFGLLANADALDKKSFWVLFRPLMGLREYKTRICGSWGMWLCLKQRIFTLLSSTCMWGANPRAKGGSPGTEAMDFPEVWGKVRKHYQADEWPHIIYWNTSWAVFSRCQIVSDNHKLGTL